MKHVLDHIDFLVREHGYKPLPEDIRIITREFYRTNLPILRQNKPIYSLAGTPVAAMFNGIIIGDYGAYIEFTVEQAYHNNFVVQPGEEYRLDKSRYPNVKYYWYTTKDESGCKIYFQVKTVSYADYKPGKCYISPYEIKQ